VTLVKDGKETILKSWVFCPPSKESSLGREFNRMLFISEHVSKGFFNGVLCRPFARITVDRTSRGSTSIVHRTFAPYHLVVRILGRGR